MLSDKHKRPRPISGSNTSEPPPPSSTSSSHQVIQPLRDLARNFDIDIEPYLQEYLHYESSLNQDYDDDDNGNNNTDNDDNGNNDNDNNDNDNNNNDNNDNDNNKNYADHTTMISHAHSIHLLHAEISAIVPRPRCKLHQHARLTWLTGGSCIHPVCGFTTHSKYYESDVRLCVRSGVAISHFHTTLRGIPQGNPPQGPESRLLRHLREGAPQHHQGIKNTSCFNDISLSLYTMITNFIIYCCYICLQ